MLLVAVSVVFGMMVSPGGAGAQSADDHGNSLSTATDLSLGSSIAGRINYGLDADVFKLDLSGASGNTNIWIYTAGDFDSWGQLHDSNGDLITLNDDLIPGTELNFHLRSVLPRGVYYVAVYSADDITTGNYTLHAQVATDPGSTAGTATRLIFDSPAPGTIDTAVDADYFRLDFTESTNVVLYARSGNYGPINVTALDTTGVTEIPVNVHPLFTRLLSYTVRDGFLIRDDFGPGTYYIRVTTPEGFTLNPVPYTFLAFEDSVYADFIEECEADTRSLSDPQISDSLYGCQWHLNNRDDQDINVEDVWAAGIKGEGVNVAVVDSGFDYTHEDLVDNVDTNLNHDYTGDGDIYHPWFHHGTHLAGILAARDNDIGVRGVAPRATMYGYNLLLDRTDLNEADAMTRNRVVTAVSNNSWGPPDGPGLSPATSIWDAAVNNGVRTGYNGKGTFYAWAGGNGHLRGDNSNLDEYANYFRVTAVCAVSDHDTRSSYSEMGANLWVCAPSNDLSDEHRGIVTTENSDRYFEDFGGTSAATPVVSGVAALMRSVNPDLTWRDLKLILADSARKNDAENPGWEDGGRKYGTGADADRYHFNHEYGFGVVDAKAAVDLAKGWSNVPPLEISTSESGPLQELIPDAPAIGAPKTIVSTLTLDTGIGFTEFVEVTVDFRHDSFRDLEIELVSPSGGVSRLVEEFDTFADDDPSIDLVSLRGVFSFGSARHLGEDPNGVWQLWVTDRLPFVDGTLESWSVTVYGHEGALACDTGGAVPDAADNPGLVSDCEALLTARDNLAGSATLNWSLRTPLADWDGVTVGGTPQRVTELDLRDSQLTGAIPADLGNLTNLQVLFLRNNQLTGPIPVELGNLANLRVLYLNINRLTGPIPAELGSLSNLRELYLSQNQLTGPIPAELGNLTNLQVLSLWGNRLTGPIPAELSSLANLQVLSLSGNRLTGLIPTELGSLSNLERLSLSNNPLSGEIPSELGGLSSLIDLYLDNNELTGPIPSELGSLLNLQVLFLSRNQLSGPIPSWLGSLTNLRWLALERNQLTGPLPAELGSLSNLQGLFLFQNQLIGPIPAELGNLSNLEALNLTQNRLSGDIPAELGELSKLRSLYLSQNQLNGCIPEGLRDVADNDLGDLGLPYCDVLLTGLTLSPGSLIAPFDPYVTEYAGVVSPSRVTVTPVNEYNSTFRFIDENDGEIADANRSLDGHQVNLGAGVTTIRIRVVSQDGQASLTYTIQISRADPPGAPAISVVTPGGGSLTVAWTAPGYAGGADIISYDVRYIESDAPDKADVNWSALDDAWTGGPLSYTITGLAGETQYDVQVRGVNAADDGPWSDKESATAAAVSMLPVFVDGATATRSVAENSAEGTVVGMPIAAGDADGNTLTYTLGGADAALFTLDENTGQIKVGAGTTLDYEADQTTYTVDVTAANPPDAGATITVTITVIDADLGPLGSHYDANNDRKIERDEVIAAIVDYFSDLITRDQTIEIIVLYFSS